MKLEVSHKVVIELRDLAPLIQQYLKERLPQYEFTSDDCNFDGRIVVTLREKVK